MMPLQISLDPPRGSSNIRSDVIRLPRNRLLIAGIMDEDRAAASGSSRSNVSPPVSDEEAGAEVDVVMTGSLMEQSRSWLSARASVLVIVGTDPD